MSAACLLAGGGEQRLGPVQSQGAVARQPGPRPPPAGAQ